MQGDKERWDALHTKGHEGLEPSAFLGSLLPHLPGGSGPVQAERFRALDLACGKGPDTLLLARIGYQVDAWDVSPVALRVLEERASTEGLDGLIECREVDLNEVEFPEGLYDLVFCRRFLDRSLLPKIRAAARIGGAVVLETFLEEQTRYAKGPKSPEHLLRYGEIRELLPPGEFEIVRWYEEGDSLLQHSLAGVAGIRRA